MTTPVDDKKLGQFLKDTGYDHDLTQELVSGFSEGFYSGYSGPRVPLYFCNHLSALECENIVQQKIEKELKHKRFTGPFDKAPYKNFIVNPLRLVPKTTDDGRNLPELFPDDEASYHLITDLRKSTVNNFINDTFTKVQYIKSDEAVEMRLTLGPSCYLGKTDIKSAFCLVPLHPSEYHLLGMKNLEKCYVDKCLPFGMVSSCQIFKKVSTAVEFIVTKKIHPSARVKHYLDDFLAGARRKTGCNDTVHNIVKICTEVGIPIANDKTVWATQYLHFFGLDLDTIRQMVFIYTTPQDGFAFGKDQECTPGQKCQGQNTPKSGGILEFLLQG